MPDITPKFVMEYERRMRAITESEYARRLAADVTWWSKMARTMTIEGKTERITWFLDTAMIEPIGPSGVGSLVFENMVTQSAEYPSFRHGKGIKIQRDQFEDLDGTGLNQVSKWSENIGSDIAYYPQRLFAQLLLNGANTDGSAAAYDGVPFFMDNASASLGHPVNPFKPGLGGYWNWLHGAAVAASGGTPAYPGALPIDESVTADVAVANLTKALAHVANFKMPNGVDPRFLKCAFIIAPPRLAARVRLLTDAKFLAMAAAGGGAGSTDVAGLISSWGLGVPVIAYELGAAFKYSAMLPFMVANTGNVSFKTEAVQGSDTTYYIVLQEMQTTQLGGLLYITRKPFKINYYSGDTQAQLDRMNEFEYHCQGRMSAQYGHPYTILRVDAS